MTAADATPDQPAAVEALVDVTGALAVDTVEITALAVALADGSAALVLDVDVAGRRLRSDGSAGKAAEARLLFGTAELAALTAAAVSALVETDPEAALALVRQVVAGVDDGAAEEVPAPKLIPVRFRFNDERAGRRP